MSHASRGPVIAPNTSRPSGSILHTGHSSSTIHKRPSHLDTATGRAAPSVVHSPHAARTPEATVRSSRVSLSHDKTPLIRPTSQFARNPPITPPGDRRTLVTTPHPQTPPRQQPIRPQQTIILPQIPVNFKKSSKFLGVKRGLIKNKRAESEILR